MDATTAPPVRTGALNALGLAGLALIAVAHTGLWYGIEPFTTNFYAFAWWGLSIGVDAWAGKRTGRSLWLERPGTMLLLSWASAAFWLWFELANLRLQNWYYVGAVTSFAARMALMAICFATVLPGVLGIERLLKSYSVFEGRRCKPWTLAPGLAKRALLLGLAMGAASMLFPRYAFFLVWGATGLAIEAYLCLRRERSLLSFLAEGDLAPILRFLLAGFIAGGTWEAWNFHAGAKWIYTVPFMERVKLGEMPVLGFLGFPPFALECYSFARLCVAVGAGPEWEPELEPRRTSVARMAGWAIAFGLLSAPAAWLCDRYTVRGLRVDPEVRAALEPGQRQLVDLKGLGLRGLAWLNAVGIEGPTELAGRDSRELMERFRVAAALEPPPPGPVPYEREVRVWLLAAADLVTAGE
jgi:hypothetical protein